MRKGLSLILAGAIAAAGAGIFKYKIDEKANLNEFGEAYQRNKITQYLYQTNPSKVNKTLYTGSEESEESEGAEGPEGTLGHLNDVRKAQGIYDNEREFRRHRILCIESKGGSSYVASIVGDPKIVDGYKVYHTNPRDFKYSMGTLRTHRTGRPHSTIFEDLDGKTAVNVNLQATDYPFRNLEEVWDDEVVKNHEYFINGDKRWNSATEGTYLTSKDVQKDQIEEEAIKMARAGTTAHEIQHAKDKDAGLLEKLSKVDFEKRGFVKGLIKNPAYLGTILRYSKMDVKNKYDQEIKTITSDVVDGIYQVNGVKDDREFFEKVKTPEDISKSAELLWNIWYDAKN